MCVYLSLGVCAGFDPSGCVGRRERGLIVGVIVFGDWPSPTMLAGAGLVVGSGLYILHREARQ